MLYSVVSETRKFATPTTAVLVGDMGDSKTRAWWAFAFGYEWNWRFKSQDHRLRVR